MPRSRAFPTLTLLAMTWAVGCSQGETPTAPDLTSVNPAGDAPVEAKGKPKRGKPAVQETLGTGLVE